MKKLTKKQLTYLDHLTSEKFDDEETLRGQCEFILKLREVLGINNDELKISFKEYFNEDFKL